MVIAINNLIIVVIAMALCQNAFTIKSILLSVSRQACSAFKPKADIRRTHSSLEGWVF